MLYYLDLFGVAVFAVTGALAAGRKHLDLFGVIVLAIVTAIGGGTFRDLVLGRTPVAWVHDPNPIIIAIAAGLLTFVRARFGSFPTRILSILDAFGLAVFTVIGTRIALSHGSGPLIAILLGIMSAAFGGVIRDVLSGEIPLILRAEIYATACALGAVTYTLAIHAAFPEGTALVLGAMVTLTGRLLAIRYRLSLPIYISVELNKDPRDRNT